MQETTEPTLQIVVFTIDDVEYALRIDAVREIIRYAEPQPTSSRVPWMRGVINLRGTIVPVIELGGRIGRDTAPIEPSAARILVLEDTASTVGAIVSSVDEVRTITAGQVQPAPAGAGSDFIASVATIDDRLVMLLDATALLTLEAQAA